MTEAGLQCVARLLRVLGTVEEMRVHPQGDIRARVPELPGDAFQPLSIAAFTSPVLSTAVARKGGVSSAFVSGRTWDRTRDLPRVKRALSR